MFWFFCPVMSINLFPFFFLYALTWLNYSSLNCRKNEIRKLRIKSVTRKVSWGFLSYSVCLRNMTQICLSKHHFITLCFQWFYFILFCERFHDNLKWWSDTMKKKKIVYKQPDIQICNILFLSPLKLCIFLIPIRLHHFFSSDDVMNVSSWCCNLAYANEDGIFLLKSIYLFFPALFIVKQNTINYKKFL